MQGGLMHGGLMHGGLMYGELADMNALDILILLVLAGGMVRGFSTGIVRQVASVVGFVLAFILSVKLMDPVGALVVDSLGLSARTAPVVGFAVVFLAIQALLFLVIRMVEALVGALKLTAVNRVLGGAVGVFKAALVLSVLFLVLGYLGIPEKQAKVGSAFYQPVAMVLPQAWDYVAAKLPEVKRLSRSADAESEPAP